MGDQNEFQIHTDPPGTTVIPGIWACRLEQLGLVRVLAGYPDFGLHQRVEWILEGFERVEGAVERFDSAEDPNTASLERIADELQKLRTLFTNGYATVHVTSQRDPL